ncbi:MAG TPA: exodeoxyribonuclease V subunit alpha [Edaphocola sp.]|nr:exodeoxyribonuclease V subunit alpha [Edaphocola sp.]
MSKNINLYQSFANFFTKKELNPWLYHLSKEMAKGNVCIATDRLIQSEEGSNLSLDYLVNPLVGKAEENTPFILNKGKLYIHRFFHYERQLIEQIKALCISEKDFEIKKQKLEFHKEFINQELFSEQFALDQTDWQKIACLNAFVNNFNIISGGPGTGKTTTVSKLLMILLKENIDLKIKICAPTGKAAARLKESLGQTKRNFSGKDIPELILQKVSELSAETIHSTLGYIPKSIYFKHNAENTLDIDVLIVDECSMIDISLFYKLFQAIDTKRTKVILLGDKNQLASVDSGSVFRDLCTDTAPINVFSRKRTEWFNQFIFNNKQQIGAEHIDDTVSHPLFEHVIELKKSYRFDDSKGIGKLSKAILNNNWEAIEPFFENKDEQITINENYKDLEVIIQKAHNLLKKEYGGYLNETNIHEVLNKMNNSIILCANREGAFGVSFINESMQARIFKNNKAFNNYQLLMVTKNQAQDGIYNGDMGVVLKVVEDENVFVYFPKGNDDFVKLSPAQIIASEPAFAMTIHKSQGSEFNEVFVILPDNKDNLLLTRELLYTAITRAKKKATILGSKDILKKVAANSVQRVSGIIDHF